MGIRLKGLCAMLLSVACGGSSTSSTSGAGAAGAGGASGTAGTTGAATGGAGGSGATDAGGAEAPKVGTYESGSRLRAHFWDGGDGATMFIDWHDASLGISCKFAHDENGTMRCLPAGRSALLVVSEPVTFLDGACTQRVLTDIVPGPQFPPYLRPETSTCPGDTPVLHVESLGAAVPVTTVYERQGTICAARPAAPGQSAFPLRPVDVSIFAPARVVVESRGGGLDVEVLVADDGTRQLGRVLDHERGRSCGTSPFTPPPTKDTEIVEGRCVPADIVSEDALSYASSDCRGLAGGAWDCPRTPPCPAPTFALGTTFTAATCSTVYDVIALGSPAGAGYHRDEMGQCTKIDVGDYCGFFARTGPVDFGMFPAILGGRLGSGRLAKLVLVAPEGGRVLAETSARFWDNALAATCRRTSFHDHVDRCVTDRTVSFLDSSGNFADAACTVPLVRGDDCGAAPPFAVAPYQTSDTISTDIDRVFAVGDVYREPVMYQRNPSGACLVVPVVPGLHLVGAPLDPDSVFASITEHTE